MVAVLNLKMQDLVYEQVENIEVKDLKEFETLPKSLYIRGELDKSKSTVDEYKAELAVSVNDEGKTVIQIINPLLWISLSAEELAETDLKGELLPDIKYLINGANRSNAVLSYTRERDQSVLEYKPVPMQRLTGNISRDSILSLQHKLNDTTRKHDAFSTMIAIQHAFKRTVDAGLSEADATKRCVSIFNVSSAYVSQALKIDPTNDDFKSLYALVDQGVIVSADVVVTIHQAIEALKLDPNFVVEALTKAAVDKLKPNKALKISKAMVDNWRKSYEKSLQGDHPTTTPAQETKPKKEAPTAEEVVKSAEVLAESVDTFLMVNKNLARQGESDVEKRHVYKKGLANLGKIAAKLTKIVPTENSEQVYEKFAVAIQDVMNEIKFLNLLDDEQKVEFSKVFQGLTTNLNELFVESEVEDEFGGADTESARERLEQAIAEDEDEDEEEDEEEDDFEDDEDEEQDFNE